MSKETNELNFDDLSSEELQKMLQDKIAELNDANSRLNKAESSIVRMESRALKVYEENAMYKASPELAAQMAEMEFQLAMAERFIKSGAFKAKNAEQAYVIIKAGSEMGMSAVESMQALYCVNGAIKFYGDKMVARVTKEGYRTQYLDESKECVSVRVYHPDGHFDETETVKRTDQILQQSKAMGFSEKNKMRFHGIRMIISFHLPHLVGSVTDEFTADFREWEKSNSTDNNGNTLIGTSNQDVLELIQQTESIEEVKIIEEDHKAAIARDITLASELGKAKKRFGNG